jgi:hypothetical protein
MKHNNTILKWAKKIRAINFLGGKCSNCDCENVKILTFHHVNKEEKEHKICNLLYSSTWEDISEEIKKCILLCYNCHQELHYNETNDNSWRKENKKILIEYKGSLSCERCGYNKCVGSLDFHHPNNDKFFSLSNVGKKGLTLDTLTTKIIDEINKCELLCKNCHYIEHINKKDYFNNYHNEIMEKSIKYRNRKPNLDENIVLKYYMNENMRMIDICKELNLSKSTVSTILKRLENKGLLKKRKRIKKKCIVCGNNLSKRNKYDCCLKCKKEYNKNKMSS